MRVYVVLQHTVNYMLKFDVQFLCLDFCILFIKIWTTLYVPVQL